MNLYFLFYFILPSCIAGDDKNGGVICAACGVVGAWVEEDGFTMKNSFKLKKDRFIKPCISNMHHRKRNLHMMPSLICADFFRLIWKRFVISP